MITRGQQCSGRSGSAKRPGMEEAERQKGGEIYMVKGWR